MIARKSIQYKIFPRIFAIMVSLVQSTACDVTVTTIPYSLLKIWPQIYFKKLRGNKKYK